MKISSKIFITIIAILLPSLATLGIMVPLSVEANMITDAENTLLHDKRVAEVLVNQTMDSFDDYEFKKKSIDMALSLRDITGLRVSVYDNTMVLADSSNIQDSITPEVNNALRGMTNYRKTNNCLYFAFPISSLGAMRLAYPLDSINDVVSKTTMFIIYIGIFITAAALIAAAVLSRILSVPVVKLDSVVKSVRECNYDADIKVKSNDEIGRLAASFKDMCDKIKTQIIELELKVENEKRLKNIQRDFINGVTHEFKTPLTSIIGYADLLSQYRDDPKLFEEALRVIRGEGERLHQMVEKVLYLSRMERFDFEISKGNVDIGKLAEKSIEGINIKAKNAGITINFHIAYTGMISGDFEMLYRMLVNLLDNSVKYNVKGGTIDFNIEKIDKDVLFTISDTGVGIANDDLGRVFQPFYRADKNRSSKIGGHGLGLSIVQDIVKKHNGSIHMESAPGIGTKVIIRIPCGQF